MRRHFTIHVHIILWLSPLCVTPLGMICTVLFSGKVDATVEVKIDRRPKIKRHRPDTGNQVQTEVLPLELKTGKMFTKLGKVKL